MSMNMWSILEERLLGCNADIESDVTSAVFYASDTPCSSAHDLSHLYNHVCKPSPLRVTRKNIHNLFSEGKTMQNI